MRKKEQLLKEIQHRITWLEGSSPITADIATAITILKSQKFIIENLEENMNV